MTGIWTQILTVASPAFYHWVFFVSKNKKSNSNCYSAFTVSPWQLLTNFFQRQLVTLLEVASPCLLNISHEFTQLSGIGGEIHELSSVGWIHVTIVTHGDHL